jgi:hypothetical protein
MTALTTPTLCPGCGMTFHNALPHTTCPPVVVPVVRTCPGCAEPFSRCTCPPVYLPDYDRR